MYNNDSYNTAYNEWIEGLPAAELRRLERLDPGLLKPLNDCAAATCSGGGKGIKEKPATNQTAYNKEKEIVVVDFPPSAAADSVADEMKERIQRGENIDHLLAEYLNGEKDDWFKECVVKIVALIIDSPNAQLELEILAQACGMNLRQGISHTQIAAEYGLSRQCFSARLKKVLQKFGLSKPRVCKAESSKQTYATCNKKKFNF